MNKNKEKNGRGSSMNKNEKDGKGKGIPGLHATKKCEGWQGLTFVLSLLLSLFYVPYSVAGVLTKEKEKEKR
jgi:hypothetical protein